MLTTQTNPHGLSSHEQDERESAVMRRQEMLASAFRDLMTRGQSLEQSNAYRQSFYQEVIKLAKEVNCDCIQHLFSENDKPSSPRLLVKKLWGRNWPTVPENIMKARDYSIQKRNFVDL